MRVDVVNEGDRKKEKIERNQANERVMVECGVYVCCTLMINTFTMFTMVPNPDPESIQCKDNILLCK